MIVHPVLAVVIIADLTALLLLGFGAGAGARVILGAGAEPPASQAATQRWRSQVSTYALVGTVVFLATSALLLVAVTSILPPLVPGAMCGTGVLRAMGDAGPRALTLRLLALGALGAWQLLDRLDRGHPDGLLGATAARTVLLATPVALLAVVSTARAVLALDGARHVDCCSTVRAAAATHAPLLSGTSIPWAHLMIGGAVPLVALGMLLSLFRDRLNPRATSVGSVAIAALAPAWAAVAAVALVEQLAAYHYGRPGHDCAFCLFSVRRGLLGYPLYGALLLVAFEGVAGALAHGVGHRTPEVSVASAARAKRAAFLVAGSVLAFLVMALVPAVSWRVEHGVWME